jgi:hypothetical protein
MVCCIIYLTYVVLLVMHAATTLITVYFVHMGIWQGAPVISSGLYIWKGIIPARRAISLGAGYSLPLTTGINTFWEKESVVLDGAPYSGSSMCSVDLGWRKEDDVPIGDSEGWTSC